MLNSERDSWLTSLPIAHRGYFNNETELPENTLGAFKKAAERGFAIELDIQVTADNQVIAFHDDDLGRLCGKKNLRVKQSTFKDLQSHHILKSTETIPLFQDVLNVVQGRVPLLVEFKDFDSDARLEQATLPLLDQYKGKFAVQSFNPFTVNWFAKNRCDWLRGLISCSYLDDPDLSWIPLKKRVALSLAPFNLLADADFIAYNVEELPHWRTTLAKLTKPVLGWTVRSQEQAQRLKPFINNVIFEKYL